MIPNLDNHTSIMAAVGGVGSPWSLCVCVCVCEFDIDVGVCVRAIEPPGMQFRGMERDNLAYLALPDGAHLQKEDYVYIALHNQDLSLVG